MRVTPHELSIHDPEFYEKLYVPGNQRKTNNYNQFVKGIDLEGECTRVRASSAAMESNADMLRLAFPDCRS